MNYRELGVQFEKWSINYFITLFFHFLHSLEMNFTQMNVKNELIGSNMGKK